MGELYDNVHKMILIGTQLLVFGIVNKKLHSMHVRQCNDAMQSNENQIFPSIFVLGNV